MTRNQAPVFYIQSPAFTSMSGGPIALHLLCHHMNVLGFECYLATDRLSGYLNTPALTNVIMEAHRRMRRVTIGIYPEIYLGNQLECQHIIRFLLNKPGQRNLGTADEVDQFWSSADRYGEFIIDFAEEFKADNLQSVSMWIPIVDRHVYYRRSRTTRDGFLVYSHRVEVSEEMIPRWAQPVTWITMAAPRTPHELAELYHKSVAMLVWERTGAMHEAMLCECPVISFPNESYKYSPMFSLFGDLGTVWGGDISNLARAQATIRAFESCFDAYEKAVSSVIRTTIHKAIRSFGYTSPY